MLLKKFKRLEEPPILHIPDNKDRFCLYSDTNKFQKVLFTKYKMENQNC